MANNTTYYGSGFTFGIDSEISTAVRLSTIYAITAYAYAGYKGLNEWNLNEWNANIMTFSTMGLVVGLAEEVLGLHTGFNKMAEGASPIVGAANTLIISALGFPLLYNLYAIATSITYYGKPFSLDKALDGFALTTVPLMLWGLPHGVLKVFLGSTAHDEEIYSTNQECVNIYFNIEAKIQEYKACINISSDAEAKAQQYQDCTAYKLDLMLCGLMEHVTQFDCDHILL